MALLAAVMLVDEIHLNVTDFAACAQVILAHQPIEVDRGADTRVDLVVAHLRHGRPDSGPVPRVRAAVCSTGVPDGMSTTTWNSDLLSNGSIFSCTRPTAGSTSDTTISAATPNPSSRRLRLPRVSSSSGRKMRDEHRSEPAREAMRLPAFQLPHADALSQSRDSHGVTTKAIASEISMPMLALIGMGLMYGPIRPVTKAIGSSAAITVSVARIVGPPTSSTAPGMISARGLPGGQMLMPVDVLDDHDRVVHQDADGEDQREQRDAIQREAPRH